jgi:hypothetical protein
VLLWKPKTIFLELSCAGRSVRTQIWSWLLTGPKQRTAVLASTNLLGLSGLRRSNICRLISVPFPWRPKNSVTLVRKQTNAELISGSYGKGQKFAAVNGSVSVGITASVFAEISSSCRLSSPPPPPPPLRCLCLLYNWPLGC